MDPLARLAHRVDSLETAHQRATAATFLAWKRGITDETSLAHDHGHEFTSRIKAGRFDAHSRRLRDAYERAQRVEIARSLRLFSVDDVFIERAVELLQAAL